MQRTGGTQSYLFGVADPAGGKYPQPYSGLQPQPPSGGGGFGSLGVVGSSGGGIAIGGVGKGSFPPPQITSGGSPPGIGPPPTPTPVSHALPTIVTGYGGSFLFLG